MVQMQLGTQGQALRPDAGPFGDSLNKKPPNTLRIGMQNFGGFPEFLKTMHADICSLQRHDYLTRCQAGVESGTDQFSVSGDGSQRVTSSRRRRDPTEYGEDRTSRRIFRRRSIRTWRVGMDTLSRQVSIPSEACRNPGSDRSQPSQIESSLVQL
jgi:hypothetical protein